MHWSLKQSPSLYQHQKMQDKDLQGRAQTLNVATIIVHLIVRLGATRSQILNGGAAPVPLRTPLLIGKLANKDL